MQIRVACPLCNSELRANTGAAPTTTANVRESDAPRPSNGPDTQNQNEVSQGQNGHGDTEQLGPVAPRRRTTSDTQSELRRRLVHDNMERPHEFHGQTNNLLPNNN